MIRVSVAPYLFLYTGLFDGSCRRTMTCPLDLREILVFTSRPEMVWASA